MYQNVFQDISRQIEKIINWKEIPLLFATTTFLDPRAK